MLLSLGTTAAFVFLGLFLLLPKRLHPLERLFAWFVTVFIYGIHFLIMSVNLHKYEINTAPDTTFILLLVRFAITPILMLWMLDIMHHLRHPLAKIAAIVVYAGVCTAGTVLLKASGTLIYHEWHPVVVFRFWSVHAILTAIGVRLFREVQRKEVPAR
jgi:hypothetical protein